MGANDFSDREKELQALAWQCFEGEPKVRYPLRHSQYEHSVLHTILHQSLAHTSNLHPTHK